MIKAKKRTRLSLLLTAYAFISLALAAAVFLGGRALGSYIVNDVIYTRERILAAESELYGELSNYIRSEGVSDASDSEKLERWVSEKSCLTVFIYDYYKQSDSALSTIGSFLSGADEGTVMYSSVSDAASIYGLLQSRYDDYWYYGPLEMRGVNGFPKVVRVMYFPMYVAERYVAYIAAALSFLAFALCLTLLFRRKTGYISTLSRQLGVMSAGELSVPMKIRGNDELTTLAENMDAMRLSFIERLKREEQLNKNASRLLTDMSHDLRTPLTALMGYLDILDSGKAGSEQQKAKYIASAKNRAYQIKGMTDELFEYFLVYSFDESRLETETADAATLFSQLWDEAGFRLESEGFTVESRTDQAEASVDVNVSLLKRVFDNIASNIIKYADRTQRVTAEGRRDGEFYLFSVSNGISSHPSNAESSHIGLNSCKKIAELHGGRFEYSMDEKHFESRLRLPVLTKK